MNSPLKQKYDQAGEGLKKALATPSETNPAPLQLDSVSIGKGGNHRTNSWTSRIMLDNEPNGLTNFVLTLKGDAIEHNDTAAGKAALDFLEKNVKALADNVAWKSPADHAEELKNTIKGFQQAGAVIPYDIDKVRMFDKKVMEENEWAIADHALHGIGEDWKHKGTGVKARAHVPVKEGDLEKAHTPNKEVLEHYKAHGKEILAKIVDGVVKYTPDLNEETEKALRAKTMALKVEFVETSSNGIEVSIRSEDQQKAFEAYKISEPFNEAKVAELNATNPLNGLPEAQLGKLLGRALLHYGPDAKEIFPLIAGSEDVSRAMKDALEPFEQSVRANNPELADKVKKFLADDAFKSHDYMWKAKGQPKLKQPPETSKDAKKFGEMEITFKIDQKAANEAIEQLAALGAAKPDLAATVAQAADAVSKAGETLTQIAGSASTTEGWEKLMAAQKALKEAEAAKPTARSAG